jgi:hypothetical protein
MKLLLVIAVTFISTLLMAQTLPHGMVYGTKPGTIGRMPASQLEAAMGKRTRISTVVTGRILRVTKSKGGWFDLDAGKGRVIDAHFSKSGINLPEKLKGHQVIVEGIAQKQFIADDMQHFAGDPIKDKQHSVKTDAKHRLTFEVKGLMVE